MKPVVADFLIMFVLFCALVGFLLGMGSSLAWTRFLAAPAVATQGEGK